MATTTSPDHGNNDDLKTKGVLGCAAAGAAAGALIGGPAGAVIGGLVAAGKFALGVAVLDTVTKKLD